MPELSDAASRLIDAAMLPLRCQRYAATPFTPPDYALRRY